MSHSKFFMMAVYRTYTLDWTQPIEAGQGSNRQERKEGRRRRRKEELCKVLPLTLSQHSQFFFLSAPIMRRWRRGGARPLTGPAPGARSAQNNHEGGKNEQELCHARCAALFAEAREGVSSGSEWRMGGGGCFTLRRPREQH